MSKLKISNPWREPVQSTTHELPIFDPYAVTEPLKIQRTENKPSLKNDSGVDTKCLC